MPDGSDLYERDFYAWTQDQAQRIRALRSNALDTDNLAEEVASLGGSDRRSAISFMRLIAGHCLKIEHHPAIGSRRHWADEIDEFRIQLELVFADSPSLRAQRAVLYESAWRLAVVETRNTLRRQGHDGAAARLPHAKSSPRYDLDAELLADDWYPALRS